MARAGQGRPQPSSRRALEISFRPPSEVAPRPCLDIRLVFLLAGALIIPLLGFDVKTAWGQASLAAQQPAVVDNEAVNSEVVELRLRFQLICDVPLQFSGTLETSQGEWSDPANLSMEAGSAGCYWSEEGARKLAIRPRTTQDRLGWDVTLKAPRKAMLKLTATTLRNGQPELPQGTSQQSFEVTIPVADLLAGKFESQVAGGVRLWAHRVSGDALRIHLGPTDSLVFNAGENIDWNVDGTAIQGLPPGPLQLQLEMRRDADQGVVWQSEKRLSDEEAAELIQGKNVRLAAGRIALPGAEGVYTLQAKLTGQTKSSAGSASRFVPSFSLPNLNFVPGLNLPSGNFLAPANLLGTGGTEPLASRSLQFIVLSPYPLPADSVAFEERARWRPTAKTLLPFPSGQAVSNQPIVEEQVGGATVSRVAPRDQLVQRLNIAQPNMPHQLVIRYRRNEGVKFTAAIRQPDLLGRLSLLGVDSAVFETYSNSPATANSSPVAEGGSWSEQSLIFWPRTTDPLLILQNNSIDTPLQIESIRLLAGPGRLAGGVSANSGGKLAAIYLDKPLLLDVFAANKALDQRTATLLDDWNTIYQATQRLIEYTQSCGANAVVMTVVGEGGSLYPTQLFSPTPRYDTGCFFSDGRDPVRKDILELLLKMFDRAGLRLIPVVELATPLPALEQQIAATGVRFGNASQSVPISPLEWSDSVGRRLIDGQPPRQGLAPYYNLLHPQVQQDVLGVFQELYQRYSQHQSFAGIAAGLGNHTYLQLPPQHWGRDPTTLAMFREHLKTIPAASLPRDFSPTELPSDLWLNRWIDGPGGEAFVSWRAQVVTQFYTKLSSACGSHPLFIATADYLPSSEEFVGPEGYPFGIDWKSLSQTGSIIPLRLQRQRWLLDAARRIDDAKMNEDTTWDRLLTGRSGSLVFYPPSEQRAIIPAFFSASGREETVSLYPSATCGVEDHCRQLLQMLEQRDPELVAIGGWAPLFGQERQLSSILATVAALPPVSFVAPAKATEKSELVFVRQARHGRSTFVYFGNPSRWAVDVRLISDATPGTRVRTLGPEQEEWSIGDRYEQFAAGIPLGTTILWAGEMQPGEFRAVEIQGPTQGVIDWVSTVRSPAEVLKKTASEVDDLASRVAILGRPRLAKSFQHGGFEAGEAGSPTGWMRSQHPPDSVQFSAEAVEGVRSVVLKNGTELAARTWLLSEPIAVSETGRLAVSVRARLIEGTPTVRLAIEGRRYGLPVRYSESLTLLPDKSWGADPYWLRIVRPALVDLEEVRIAIDLLGPGAVAIDDVQLYDFFFSERERADLQRQTFVAAERLKRGDLSVASKLLDSHWSRYLRKMELSKLEEPSANKLVPPQSPAANADPEPVGVAERIRSWLPSPLRF